MIEIKFNTLGKIIEGDNQGWFVRIINDEDKTGGYYIHQFKDMDGNIGFDDWLETENDVKGYIYESNWKIKWLKDRQEGD